MRWKGNEVEPYGTERNRNGTEIKKGYEIEENTNVNGR